MVRSKNYSSFLHLLSAQRSMEIAVLLLLIVPLTAALPHRSTRRSNADTVHSGDTVQTSGVKRSKDTQKEHVPAARIIPFHLEDKHLDLMKQSMTVRLRPRRARQRGCQLGTCQLHNLASTLFNFSKTIGKDESKKATDPHGYGR